MKPIKFVKMVSILGAALGFSTTLFAQEFTPFKSKDAGTFTESSTNTPGVVLTQDTATGEGTRVGRYKLVASELIRLSDLSITNGHYTLTAADGSTLSGAYEGHGSATSMPGVISWDVCGPLTSGTGRFANASGAICFFGTGNLATGLFSEISVGLLTSTIIDDSDDH
jgi:hypothetical protein